MDQSFITRDLRDDERAAAAELTLEAYAQYEQLMPPGAWPGLHKAIQVALASDDPREQIVAERDGALIGSVMLFPASGGDTAGAGGRMIWPELRLLAVAPAARGQGVGAALVRVCIERARAAHAPTLGLYTSDSMRAAQALYQRFGFTRVPAYDFLPPGGELVKAFRLDLSAEP
jgi:predicted N-acetyltransferase YhbS